MIWGRVPARRDFAVRPEPRGRASRVPGSAQFQRQSALHSSPEEPRCCQDSSALELSPCIEAKKAWIRQALGHAKKPRVFSDFRGENVVFIGRFGFSATF